MDKRGLRHEMLAMLHDETSVEPGLLASAHFVRAGSAQPASAAAAGMDGGVTKVPEKLDARVKEEPGTVRPSLAGRRESQKMDRALQELQVQREKMRREQEAWMAQEMSGLEAKEAHLLALKVQHTTEMEILEAAKQEHALQQKVLETASRALQREKESFGTLMGAEREKLEREKEAAGKEIAGMRAGVEGERQKMILELKNMRHKVSEKKLAVEEEAASMRRIIEREREDMERDVEAQRAAARGEMERMLAEATAEREKAREMREAVESEMVKVEEKQLAVVGKEEALEISLVQHAEDRMKLKAEIEEEIGGQIEELREERNEIRREREALQAELGAVNEGLARLEAERARALSIQNSTLALQDAAKVVCKQTNQMKKERKKLTAAAAKAKVTEIASETTGIVVEAEASLMAEKGTAGKKEEAKKSSGWLRRFGLFGAAKTGAGAEESEDHDGVKVHVKYLETAEAAPLVSGDRVALAPGVAASHDSLVKATPVKVGSAVEVGDKVVDVPVGAKKRSQQEMEGGGGGEGQVAPRTPAEKVPMVEGHDAAKKAKVLVAFPSMDE